MPLSMPPRYERLGGARLAANAQSLSLTVPARDVLRIEGVVVGFSAADTAGLRFNGATTNYWYRNLHSVAGGTALTNEQLGSAAVAKLNQIAGTQQVLFDVEVSNRLASTKIGVVEVQQGTGAAATVGGIHVASGFEWVNTTAQITTVELRIASTSTTINMLADTYFVVSGTNV